MLLWGLVCSLICCERGGSVQLPSVNRRDGVMGPPPHHSIPFTELVTEQKETRAMAFTEILRVMASGWKLKPSDHRVQVMTFKMRFSSRG